MLNWIIISICGLGAVILARGQPNFPLGFVRRTRSLNLSVYEVFIVILLFAIFLLRLIAIDPFSYRHVVFIVMLFRVIAETIGIMILLAFVIFLDKQAFPNQQSRSLEDVEAEEERIYYEEKGMPTPDSAKNRSGEPKVSFPWRGGLVLHFGSTAGWTIALWYFDDPNSGIPMAILTFFVCGVISWLLVIIAYVKAYLNH